MQFRPPVDVRVGASSADSGADVPTTQTKIIAAMAVAGGVAGYVIGGRWFWGVLGLFAGNLVGQIVVPAPAITTLDTPTSADAPPKKTATVAPSSNESGSISGESGSSIDYGDKAGARSERPWTEYFP